MEHFVSIKGYEKYYQISNMGNVKILPRWLKRGKGKFLSAERLMKICINETGYCYVKLADGLSHKHFKVHRIVAQHFIGNLHNKPDVNHIDGIKTNNAVSNLEWVTRKENTAHAVRNCLNGFLVGAACSWRKITDAEVEEIRSLKGKLLMREIAAKFGIATSYTGLILSGKRRFDKHDSESTAVARAPEIK